MCTCLRAVNSGGRPVDVAMNSRSIKIEIAWAVVLALACASAIYGTFHAIQYEWNWAAIWEYRALVMRGWVVTLLLSLGALVLSVVIGLLLMTGQRSRIVPVRLFSRGFVEVIRGTPLLVQLLIGYYGVANALHIDSSMFVGIVILAFFEGAYLAEIFRAAWESISASQLEAAKAVGFNRLQTWRYVIFPQAVRRALPGTAGQMVSLVKDSSLLSVISIEEVTQRMRTAYSNTYAALEGFIPLALLYLAITLPLSWWARRLETKFKYET